MRNLENKITDLESHLSGSNDIQIWDDINQTKETLNDLIKKKPKVRLYVHEYNGMKKETKLPLLL